MKYYKSEVAATPSTEEIPVTVGETYVLGEAIVLTDGKATKASGTAAPLYISAATMTGEEGKMLLCVRVLPDQTWEALLTADGAALAVGDKVTISADGIGVTATTGGAAEIVQIVDAASGGKVRVRFA